MKLKITQIGKKDRSRRYSKTLAVVYIDNQTRPLDNGQILDDFAWRRNHSTPQIDKEKLLKILEEVLPTSIENLIVKYDRNAGCSMCPCSPGFVIKSKPGCNVEDYRRSFWIEVYDE